MNLLDELAQQYGTDKRIGLHGYTRIYDKMFYAKRLHIDRVVEIGIYTGASIHMWLDYFPNAMIYGIDQMEVYCKTWDNNPRVQAVFGDANNPELWNQFPGNFFNIIIEDASHVPDEQIKMFELGFPHVVPGGYYIIEDTQTSYTHNTDKLFRYFYNRMLDMQVNGFHLGDFYIARQECGQSMSELAKQIYSIHFYKSLIVVERAEEL